MKIEFVLNILFLSLLFLLTVFIFVTLLAKSLLFNHKRLAVAGKKFYNYFYALRGNYLPVNNYGCAPIDEEVALYPQDVQYGIQLYKELVKDCNNYLTPQKFSIVEVGCGKGAGAEFLLKKLSPKIYTGIDYSEKAIGYCIKNYGHLKKMNFICADAHCLPISDNSEDVVINVESSHIYKNQIQFFKEVHRILKPGGKFLFSDYRYIQSSPMQNLEEEIAGCGFSTLHKKIITPQIYNACILAAEQRKKLINEASPWYLKKYFNHYAALPGTKKLSQFGNGEIVYFIYHLEKQSD